MIDWLYIAILILGALLMVVQELSIRAKDKIIKRQDNILRQVEPILAMVVAAQEAALADQRKIEQPKVH